MMLFLLISTMNGLRRREAENRRNKIIFYKSFVSKGLWISLNEYVFMLTPAAALPVIPSLNQQEQQLTQMYSHLEKDKLPGVI